MRRIGILTFHFTNNYGAILQCYALRKVINQIPGYEAEIINFNPGCKNAHYMDENLQAKYEMKLAKFESFNQVENRMDKTVLFDIGLIEQERYYGFVVGSDQIWNPSFEYFNTAYLLDFVNGKQKKISYAASVGLPVDSPKMKREVFEKYIPLFDSLSVRERTHEKFIAGFTNKNVQTVLDPTLLLTAADYDSLIVDTENDWKEEDDYIFFYYLSHDDTSPLACSFVNMLSRKYNLKVIYHYVEMPDFVFKNESRSFFFDGPKDFIWYIKHAKFVVTNSFHGTVFSILYHKPFYTYIVEHMRARILDLLCELDLEERLIRGYKPLNEVSLDINYDMVDKKLNRKRQESLDFLYTALR